ncbi:desumoylating isopeptidase 1 isoform X3 [Dioscorea cayenensis subsp. rotundata]|uniref:Desumoylating isopeptidase 1 isoform X3 n=1 Tax=Dioscorea cayennensis subsp. rotundata TaxID=55577 RepID=A0AB40CBF4_DIOCR|nr:desumoylating isopeptidase 1 isoform X3 [Dioscorea cayenensis subsp. rotundata]
MAEVTLNVYDLSQGLARQLSMSFLGKAIEGIWHTGVVVYDEEYYFSGGIQHDPAGRTPYGTPIHVVELGFTHIPKDVFREYLQEISPRYTPESYNILTHNCNNFSNEIAQFLVGISIPDYILQLPNEVMSSPMGGLILPMIQRLDNTLRSGAVPQAAQFTPSPTLAQPTTNKPPSGKSDNQTTEAKNVTVKPAAAIGKQSSLSAGDARAKVQEEITREFEAIMAMGTLRASEAAALATRRIMQKYGHLKSTSMSQG